MNISTRSWVYFFIVLALLPFVIIFANQAVFLLSFAKTVPADIKIDFSQSLGDLPRPWEGLAQGGELEDGRIMLLGPAKNSISQLRIKYIRLDHVLDYPFEERVREVVDTGATPFVSLSYFPQEVASYDVGEVTNWGEWQRIVTNLVERVSGKNGYNLHNVYYEVWNEPDGPTFGEFQIGAGKDYFVLYQKTIEAIARAQNVNSFKVGGPALADPKRCSDGLLFICKEYFLGRFLELVSEQSLRLDFVSWHRYGKKISEFEEDLAFVGSLTSKYPNLAGTEKVLSEWSSDSERDQIHGSIFDAAHLVAMMSALAGKVDLATKFEIRDGPQDSSVDGVGWGLIKYDGTMKSAFAALRLLDLLRSEWVPIEGEGSLVTGLASRDNSGFTLILANYDQAFRNTQDVPVSVINLIPGRYRLNKYIMNSASPLGSNTTGELDLSSGTWQTSEVLFPNSVVLWDLQLIGI